MSYARLLPVVVERNILTFAYEANQNLREIVINCAYNIQVTILTLRLNVRSFISVPQLTRVSSLQSPSSAPMEPSSTRTTSSATGGSTLTAQSPRDSTHWMIRLQLNVKNLQAPLPMLCPLTPLALQLHLHQKLPW